MDDWFDVLEIGDVPAVDREGCRHVLEVHALVATSRAGSGVLLESEVFGGSLRLTASDARELAASLLAAAHALELDLDRR